MTLRLTEKQFRQLRKTPESRKKQLATPRPVASCELLPGGFHLFLPLQVVSEINRHEHWRSRHRRNRAQQVEVMAEWYRLAPAGQPALPCTVRLIRLGGKRLDSDNLAGAFKHVRDAVARLLGVDDGDPAVTWTYAQESDAGAAGIRIEVLA